MADWVELVFCLPEFSLGEFELLDAVSAAGFGNAVVGLNEAGSLVVEYEVKTEGAEHEIQTAARSILRQLPVGSVLSATRPVGTNDD